jgi:hypothetical protein
LSCVDPDSRASRSILITPAWPAATEAVTARGPAEAVPAGVEHRESIDLAHRAAVEMND